MAGASRLWRAMPIACALAACPALVGPRRGRRMQVQVRGRRKGAQGVGSAGEKG
jgi:hypothetical protein